MSRTKRKHSFKNEDIPEKKFQESQKGCVKRSKRSMHRDAPEKFHLGPGGINCPCCTNLPPDELKVACRRAERRKGKINIKKEIDNG